MYVCIYVCMYVYVYICIYIYVYGCIYVHISETQYVYRAVPKMSIGIYIFLLLHPELIMILFWNKFQVKALKNVLFFIFLLLKNKTGLCR